MVIPDCYIVLSANTINNQLFEINEFSIRHITIIQSEGRNGMHTGGRLGLIIIIFMIAVSVGACGNASDV